eukprot:370318-Rhodomonas_salina.1
MAFRFADCSSQATPPPGGGSFPMKDIQQQAALIFKIATAYVDVWIPLVACNKKEVPFMSMHWKDGGGTEMPCLSRWEKRWGGCWGQQRLCIASGGTSCCHCESTLTWMLLVG